MKVSMKGDYGARALVELAHHFGEGPVQSAIIANRQSIPEPYLDQLLTTLRRAGFIRSVRGPQGGHALVREPAYLRVTEVIEVLEGSIMPADCLDDGSVCARTGGCAQSEMWRDVRDAILGVLDNTSIADLARRDRALQPTGTRYVI